MKKPSMPHIEWHDVHTNVMTHVYCHKCGAVLQGLVPDEHPYESHNINGKVASIHMALMAVYPAYQEITVKMDDGSHHVMAYCSFCAQVVTIEDVEKHYAHDAEAFRHESNVTGSPHRPHLYSRKPTEVIHRTRQE
ncbi:MAG: hypothetical protein KGI05_04605 [Thaumarchaeota archaeon]|nr:hypothetical protein [Nitrososphaerota archaeon]